MPEIDASTEAEMREAIANAARLARPQMIAAARVQLTCAALAGLRASETNPDRKSMGHEFVAEYAIGDADACLALLFPEPA